MCVCLPDFPQEVSREGGAGVGQCAFRACASRSGFIHLRGGGVTLTVGLRASLGVRRSTYPQIFTLLV